MGDASEEQLSAHMSRLLNTRAGELDIHGHFEPSSYNGRTCLMLACISKYENMVEYLLSLPQLDVNAREANSPKKTALHYAIQYQRQCFELLLEHPDIDVNSVDENLNTPLFEKQEHHWMKLLLDNPKTDVNHLNINGETPLFAAINSEDYYGRDEIVELLIGHKDINLKRNKYNSSKDSLLLAMTKGDCKVLELLMDHPYVKENFLEEYESYNNIPILMHAFKNTDKSIFEALLQHPNINVNCHDEDGKSLLMLAFEKGYPRVGQLLTANPNLDVSYKDRNGKTALHYASTYIDDTEGYNEGYDLMTMLETLLEFPATDVNSQDNDGNTPLMLALIHGHQGAAMRFLRHPNIDVNLKNKGGKTAFTVEKNQKAKVIEHEEFLSACDEGRIGDVKDLLLDNASKLKEWIEEIEAEK